MLSIMNFFENENEDYDEDEMKQHFEDRTNYHISLVNKYLDKIINLNLSNIDNGVLMKEKDVHDYSKFEYPETEPYLHINWKYHLKDCGIDYQPGKEIESQMQEAIFHHIKNNSHHPEAWDEDLSKDRSSAKIVNAIKMPLSYIACMVADWCAMSEEKDNIPQEWASKNINKRWKFSKDQEDFIYNIMNKIWGE